MSTTMQLERQLTQARRHGLATLMGQPGGMGYRSNITDKAFGYVYWQTANWLIVNGLAYQRTGPQRDVLQLTEAGYALAREAQIA